MKKNIYLGLTLDTKTAWLFYTPFNFETLKLFNDRIEEDYKFSQDDFSGGYIYTVTEWKYDKNFRLSAVAITDRYFKILRSFEVNQKFNIYSASGYHEIVHICEINEIDKAEYDKILSEEKKENKKYAFDVKTAFYLRSIYYDYYLNKIKPLEQWTLRNLKNFCGKCLCHAPSDCIPFDCPFAHSGNCLQNLSPASMLAEKKNFMEKLLAFDDVIRQQLREEKADLFDDNERGEF